MGKVIDSEKTDQDDRSFSSLPRSGCEIKPAIEALADPSGMPALRDVVFGNGRGFREPLHGSAEWIASRIPGRRLERLVATACSPGKGGA
jgi:hypothetical protein